MSGGGAMRDARFAELDRQIAALERQPRQSPLGHPPKIGHQLRDRAVIRAEREAWLRRRMTKKLCALNGCGVSFRSTWPGQRFHRTECYREYWLIKKRQRRFSE
jgi:hypothetical protein